MEDIAHRVGRERVQIVVGEFYDRIQRHETLAAPFGVVHDWPEHKAHIAHFWWVTLGGRPYRDKPYRVAQKHAAVGFTPALLADWLALFRATLAEHLPADLAGPWYARAERIGESLVLMHEFQKAAHGTPLPPIGARR